MLQMSNSRDFSMATSDVVDGEVRELVERACARAKTLLSENMGTLHELANMLLEQETVDGDEFMQLFSDGKTKLAPGLRGVRTP